MHDDPFTRYSRERDATGSVSFVQTRQGARTRLSGVPWLDDFQSGPAPQPGALLCPVLPSKIIGIGRNYRAHAVELGNEVPKEPLLFFKPPSALLGPQGLLRLPHQSTRVEHEGELGVIIGKRCRGVSAAEALDYVFGYTAVCDVTARDLQRADGQWARAKGFDGFCPAGPQIVSGVDPADLRVAVEVNGSIRQDGRTRDMIFSVPELIAYISQVMTLEPGDLIATGTPEGVSPLKAGDHVAVIVEHVGVLEFDVEGG